MISTRATVDISRSAGEVFEYLTQLEKYPLWQSGMIKVEYEPPLKKGTLAKGWTSNFGIEVEVGVEITGFEPPRRMEVESRLGPLKFVLQYIIEGAGSDSCSLRCVTELETGSTYSIAEPIIADMGQVKLDSDLRSLKILLEKGA
jgi:hypothetical protein